MEDLKSNDTDGEVCAKAMADAGRTVTSALADLCLEQSNCKQPDNAVHAAKRCLIDWFAATIPGAVGKPASALERGLLDELGHGCAYTVSGKRTAMRTAALINGTASHTVEFDDIYSPAIYHPGSPVIAAALAACEGLGKTGRDLVNSVIAGYEVSTRVGEAMGPAHYRYWHNTGTVGTIGAAAAVALLRDLSKREVEHAIAASVTMGAGLQAAFRGNSDIKPIHAGHAADAGHVAVALALGGVQGPADIFEGEVGLGKAMSRNVDWQPILHGRDAFNITRTTIKNHGCCGHVFAALDGLLALRQEFRITPDTIDTIEIGGYSATVDVTGNYHADTPGAAKFCLPFILASGLVHGNIRLDAYSEERLRDPQVRAVMPRISVKLDKEVDALFPRQRAASVWVTMKDGTLLHHFQPHRIGDPDLPLSDRQLEDKFFELVTSTISSQQATKLLHLLWSIEAETDLSGIQRILRG